MTPPIAVRTALSLLAMLAAMPASAGLYMYSKIEYPSTTETVSTHSVNQNGQLAVNLDDGSSTAYLWSAAGNRQKLLSVDGFQSHVVDVNVMGVAVGVSYRMSGGRLSGATVWNGDMVSLLPGLGGSQEGAYAINDAGAIVGFSYTRMTAFSGVSRAVLWDADGVHDLGTGGGTTAAAFGLNNNGTVVGSTRFENGEENGTLWKDGTVTHVGTLGGSRSSLGDVNDNGWAVGNSLLAGDDENWRAVLWDGFSLRNLGTLGGRLSSAYDIAEDGTVFGSASTTDEKEHATMWREGHAIDLHDLVVNTADLGHLTLSTAIGADGDGNIYGYLYDRKTYRPGTFVLTPVSPAEVPEPGSLSLLAAGLLYLVSRRAI